MSKSLRLLTVSFALLSVLVTVAAFGQKSDLQQRFAAVQQAIAENKQNLQQYQWNETTQRTLKEDAKPPTQNLCRSDRSSPGTT